MPSRSSSRTHSRPGAPRSSSSSRRSPSPTRTDSASAAIAESAANRWERESTVIRPASGRSAAGTASPLRGAVASGPTRSPRTVPASTLASWWGSPTSTRWASGRSASSSRAIIGSETIEVSSTTTRSCGRGFERSWRNRCVPREPRSRWSVVASLRATVAATAGGTRPAAVSSRTSRATASPMVAAALPVGAASASRGTRPWTDPARCAATTRRATVRVLPVPGPPASTETRSVSARRAAWRWRSGCPSPSSKRRSSTASSGGAAPTSPPDPSWLRSPAPARSSSDAATARS